MRGAPWVSGVVMGIGVGCASESADLPQVKTPTAFQEPVVPVVPPAALFDRTAHIADCVETAWASKCDGRVSFDADVNQAGQVAAVRFQGDASPELRHCIRGALKEGLLLSQASNDNRRRAFALRGGITWPRDGGTSVSFAGDTVIIPCLRQCSEKASNGHETGCS
jgi:hypothetical protein